MSGYLGTKAVTLSTTTASVGGDSTVGGDLTVDTNTLYVDSTNNRVGVGTSSPADLLEVQGSGDAVLRIKSTGGNVARLDLDNNATGGHEWTISSWGTTYAGSLIISDETASAERMRISSTGDVGIGGVSPSDTLHVEGPLRAFGIRTRTGSSGSWGANTFNINWSGSSADLYIDTTNVGTIQVVSDYRIKRNVETQISEALPRVMQLRPVTYQPADYGKLFKSSDEVKEGFIAHELAEVVPSAVQGEKDDPNQIQSLKLDALVSVLTKAIQEQQAKIEALEARVTALEGN